MNRQFVRIYSFHYQHIKWQRQADCPYNDDVAVFKVSLAEGKLYLSYLQTLLSVDEADRVRRFKRADDQERFIVSRGVLRILSGRYLDLPPSAIHFIPGKNQKPLLQNNPDWHINAAHSGNWVVIAVSRACVGVDTEEVTDRFSFREVMAHSFSPEEQHYVEAGHDGRQRFYQLWTRKEAIVKAVGKGIDDDFAYIPSLAGEYQVSGDRLETTGSWTVNSFAVANGYPAAVAHRFAGEKLKFYSIDSGVLTNYES